MKISAEWFMDSKYPSFNLNLHSAEGKPAFLTIKGCKIMTGDKGEWVAYPAQKNERSGKWWNHCSASDAFNAEVILIAKAAKPEDRAPRSTGYNAPQNDMPDDIPW